MKLLFRMFAEDIGLLPSKVFSRSLTAAKKDSQRLAATLASLFQAMSRGGMFGPDEILYFNGGLFADADVIELRPDEIEQLVIVAGYDWSSVEPSIFGTLFERTLDPAKRAQIGAHYTSREDILTIVEPVVMTPLRCHWREVQAACDDLWDKLKAAKTAKATRTTRRKQLDASCWISWKIWPTWRCWTRLAAAAISCTSRFTCCWTCKRKSSPMGRCAV